MAESVESSPQSIERPYAGSRVCYDADSHLMPEQDFLQKHADPKYREALRIAGGENGGEASQSSSTRSCVRRASGWPIQRRPARSKTT